jgi:hypothetical protein
MLYKYPCFACKLSLLTQEIIIVEKEFKVATKPQYNDESYDIKPGLNTLGIIHHYQKFN